jgi:hydroxyacylglutathione hydrolase
MNSLTAPRQVSPHLFIVYSEFPHRDSANVYLLTGRVPTLIDCGSRRAVPQLVRNIEQAGVGLSDISQVIATHGDCDHVQGYHDLHKANPQLRLHLQSLDWPLVQESNPYRNANYLYRNEVMPIAPELCRPVADGDHIPAGDGELTVLHTPGHTEGSISLWGEIDGHNVVFAGDTVGGCMKSLQGADVAIWVQALRTWEQSLERLARLDIDWIFNGHEPEATLPLIRSWLDRGVASFGKMMNPWFLLSDETDGSEPVALALLGDKVQERVSPAPVRG